MGGRRSAASLPRRLALWLVRGSMLLVGADDRAHQLVPDHIAFGKIDGRDPGGGFERLERFRQPGTFVWWQINLGDVSSDNALGAWAHSREQHEHLFGGRVLRFV